MWLSNVSRSDGGRLLILPSKNWKYNVPTHSSLPPSPCWKEMTRTGQSPRAQRWKTHIEDMELTWQDWKANLWTVTWERSTSILVSHCTLDFFLQRLSLYFYKYSDCQASPVSPDQAPSHSLDHILTHRGSSFYSEHGNVRHILCNECFLHIISFNSPNSSMWLVSLLSHFKDGETQA